MRIDLNDILNRRDGKTGRNPEPDFHRLYAMCADIAADPTLRPTDAAWRQIMPPGGPGQVKPMHRSAVRRLVRKLRQSPFMLEQAKRFHEGKVERVLSGARSATLSLSFRFVKTRREFDILFMSQFPLSYEVMDDPRIVKVRDAMWREVRPTKLELLAMGYGDFGPDSVMGAAARGRSLISDIFDRVTRVDDFARPDHFTRMVAGWSNR